jgi:hypothetical protein
MEFQMRRSSMLAIALSIVVYASVALAQDSAKLYLAHAASGRDISSSADPAYPIDISFNGVCVVKGQSFGEILGPFSLPTGSAAFVVSLANSLDPCSNPTAFAGSYSFGAGSFLGVVANAGSSITGKIYPLGLPSLPVGVGRSIIANATPQNLAATVTPDPRTDGSGGQFAVSAGTLRGTNSPTGQNFTSVYLEGTNTLQAGPYGIEIQPRNVYLWVLAGSATNHSVQLIGPKAILNVF